MTKQKPNYIKQPLYRFCGHCQIKVISEYINQENKGLHFIDYSPSWISKVTGFVRPMGIVLKLKSLGLLITKVSNCKSDYISNIKKEIDIGNIILINIGHGYIGENSKFNVVRGIILQHWISIWGYDHGGVYIYDSSCDDEGKYNLGNIYISWYTLSKGFDISLSRTILSIGSSKFLGNQ